jgi:hypothetical protein
METRVALRLDSGDIKYSQQQRGEGLTDLTRQITNTIVLVVMELQDSLQVRSDRSLQIDQQAQRGHFSSFA